MNKTLDRLAWALVLVLAAFVASTLWRAQHRGQSPATDSSAANLAVTVDRDSVVQDSLQALIDAQADSLRAMHQRVARVLRLADSLRRFTPPPPDTSAGALAYWKDRALRSEQANDLLAGELTSVRSQGELAAAATARLHALQLTSKDDIIAAANLHITNLTADVARLEDAAKCWYLRPVVPCLPRAVEVVVLVGAGALLAN